MKKIIVFSLLVFCLGMTGCSKDAEIEAFIKEMDGVTKDIVSKIDANPTAAGVDDAQKAFDARKAELKTKMGRDQGRGRHAGQRGDEEKARRQHESQHDLFDIGLDEGDDGPRGRTQTSEINSRLYRHLYRAR